MTEWSSTDIEDILESQFVALDCEPKYEAHELLCEFGGLLYNLTIYPQIELVHLRADSKNTQKATPQFEFSLRCDRIRTGDGGYESRAIYFDFLDGVDAEGVSRSTRLVIDRLRSGDLYIWPVIGPSDPALE
ncbi:hypothetical protein GCM10007100_40000 [Roseibacillus persicicus]|uniref:Uncharacterized protein n=1 Tax=Roseibacillus persicicus TaxID=454148 RepID=A0A918TY37_9BACT|nr:hypothetical protein GCM10007100_40000 [Roseibacillus persicicus]